MATELHHLSDYDTQSVPDASNMCFGIVVAEWNPEITDALLDGAVKTLEKHGTLPENIHIKTVPGSFELIYGAQQMTKNDGFDAVIILGSVIRGEQGGRVCHRCHQDGEILNATTYRPVLKIPCRPVVDMRIADSCVLLLCRICSPKKTKNIKGNSESAYTERRQNTDKSGFCCLSASLCKNERHP